MRMRMWAVATLALMVGACGGQKPSVDTKSAVVAPEPTEEEKAAAAKLARLNFIPTVGMRRAELDEALGKPQFEGLTKEGEPFSMYEMEANYRTVVFDRDGAVVRWDPAGPIAPLGPSAPQAPN